MNIRLPFRAGSFYEAAADSCRLHAERIIDSAVLDPDLPPNICAGLVPHAGWVYSGRLAALTIKAIVAGGPKTIVLFGADHTGVVRAGEVYDSGVWRTPLGEVAVDEELAAELIDADENIRANPNAHQHEHSLEVQIPFIQLLAPEATIVPIAVPPTSLAIKIGQAVGKVLADRTDQYRVLGSTDLSHHGGGRFPAPGGRGEQGQAWTAENDRRMIDIIEAINAAAVIPEAEARRNSCGAGAIVATIAAAAQMGATAGRCLEYSNSYKIIREIQPTETDDTTVGYASVIFA